MVPALGLLMAMSLHQTAPTVIPLWPNGAPGSESRKSEPETTPHPWSIANIYNPSVTAYLPEAGKANGTAVVIAPGGGHKELVVGEEGTKPAAFFTKLGVTAFVLKYRLAREDGSGLTVEKDTRADAFRAMRLVRSRAKEWNIDPQRIGMIGFSAGGEVLSMATFGPAPANPAKPDEVDLAEAKPNFAIWIYPGPLGIPEKIPADAPPAFMLVAQDDWSAGLILGFSLRYLEAKASCETHVLSGGGHGFNMGNRSNLVAVQTWSQRLADWLQDRGLLTKK